MLSQTTTQFEQPPNDFLGLLRTWFKPRAKDRDEAFRERTIRVTLAIIFVPGVLSFGMSVFVYQSVWSLISFPTIHAYAFLLIFLSAYFVIRHQLFSAGVLLTTTVIGAGIGLVMLNGPQDPISSLMTGVGVYVIGILIAALVLPRSTIVPLVLICVALFVAVSVALQITVFTPTLFFTMGITLLVAAILLRQLRVEFDSRLDVMASFILQTEQAKHAADISREQAEAARQQAEVQRLRAETADRTKSQFLANMSHELRTPLNAIIGYDEAMLGGMVGSFSDEQTRLLTNIQHNSRRLLGLINDILDLSKIESGSLEVYLSPISPHKVIQETLESVRALTIEKKILLSASFTEDVPEVVLGDTKKLQQILVNLLSNAIKFTNQGEVKITVDTVDNAHWKFEVKDSGIGMPADSATYIFEPFRQIDSTETRKHKGTGLGLAITKRLVETLGGTINVETQIGKGSAFIVKLPRAHVPEIDDARVATL